MKKKILISILILLIIALISLIMLKSTYKKEIILNYTYIGEISENFVVVSDGNNFSYFDINNNKLLTNLKYQIPDTLKNNDQLTLNNLIFKDGLAPIYNNNLIGLIDKKGSTIIEPSYEYVKVLNQNLILVYKNSKYYFINHKGEKLFNLKFEIIEIINDNTFIIYDDNKYGIINNNGNFLLNYDEYDEINYIKNDTTTDYIIYTIKDNQRLNYLFNNNKLTKIEQITNLTITTFNENNIYLIDNEGYYNIYNINDKTNKKLQNKYVAIDKFINGIALAINDDMKTGFINESEKIIIPFEYNMENTTNFNAFNYAIVSKDNLIGIIDNTKKEIIPIKYKDIYIIKKDRFLVYNENNQVNIIDKDENNFTNNNYISINIEESSEYLIIQDKNNLYGIINNNGEEIIKPAYKNIKIYNNYFIGKIDESKYIIEKINIKNADK